MAVYDSAQSVVDEDAPRSKKSKKVDSAAAASASSSAAAAAPLVRFLYYKSHSSAVGADDGLKPGCTLFVVNLPFHYTAEHLVQLFGCFGAVEQVAFLQSNLVLHFDPTRVGAVEPSSFYRSAHVVYESADCVDVAVKTDLSRTPQQCPEEAEDEVNVGMKSQSMRTHTHDRNTAHGIAPRSAHSFLSCPSSLFLLPSEWLSHYHSSHPLVSSLQLQVDKFMEGFDARSAQEKADARKGVHTDADGWTMVKGTTRGKKRQMMAVEEESQRAQERAAKKAKGNQVLHFYKHQEREEKKERLIQLREKFEQDKLKIAKMKQDRKFKPY
jgi:hypothetical protein